VVSVLRDVLRAATAPVRAWDRFFFAEIDARRLALLRIGVGIIAFLTLLWWAPRVELLDSDAGWLPASDLVREVGASSWSLLYVITTPFAVKVFHWLAMASALAMAIGLFSRAAAWATFVTLVSFQHRDALIVYGGDVVLRLLVLGVALGPSGATLSVDAWLRRLSDAGGAPRATMPAWPLRLIQIQIAVIYLMTGLAKLHGSTWRDGTAIAYALALPQLVRFDLSPILALRPVAAAVRALAWFTVSWELGFALLVCSRLGRRFALGVGLAFHLGIIVFMRIHWFGYIMIVSYLAFVRVETLLAAPWVRRVVLRARLARLG
jgi:Vitamin K-dependent gamma-carboxylase